MQYGEYATEDEISQSRPTDYDQQHEEYADEEYSDEEYTDEEYTNEKYADNSEVSGSRFAHDGDVPEGYVKGDEMFASLLKSSMQDYGQFETGNDLNRRMNDYEHGDVESHFVQNGKHAELVESDDDNNSFESGSEEEGFEASGLRHGQDQKRFGEENLEYDENITEDEFTSESSFYEEETDEVSAPAATYESMTPALIRETNTKEDPWVLSDSDEEAKAAVDDEATLVEDGGFTAINKGEKAGPYIKEESLFFS